METFPFNQARERYSMWALKAACPGLSGPGERGNAIFTWPPGVESPRVRQPGDMRPAGYLELLVENAPFRRLFCARTISLLGDWFNTLAVLALLREIGDSGAMAFGWILILKTLPRVFMTPFAGVIVDRHDRKRLMIGTDVLQALLVLACFTVEFAGSLGPLLLYGLIFLMTAVRAVADPAHTAVIPDLVARKDLITANAISSAAWSVMFTLGTAFGGLVTAGFGWKTALLTDAFTYLLSIGLILGLVIPSVERLEAVSGSFVDGLRYLAARPRVWTLTVVKMGWSLAGAIGLVLTILGERVYSRNLESVELIRALELDTALLGVTALYVARGIGTGFGPILARWLGGSDSARAEKIMAFAFFWSAGFYILLGFLDSLPLVMLTLIVAHLGGATVWVFSTVRLQASVPTEVRGRVFACEQGGFTLTMALSTFLFSTAIDAEVASLATITSFLGVVMAVPGTLWLIRCAVLGFGRPRRSLAR